MPRRPPSIPVTWRPPSNSRELDVVDPDHLLSRRVHDLLVQDGLSQGNLLGPERHGAEACEGIPQPDGPVGGLGHLGDAGPGENPLVAIRPAEAEFGHLRPGPEREDKEVLEAPDLGPLGIVDGAVPELGEGQGRHGGPIYASGG